MQEVVLSIGGSTALYINCTRLNAVLESQESPKFSTGKNFHFKFIAPNRARGGDHLYILLEH